MTKINYEIIPGVGLEQVRIGMSINELEAVLGHPNEIEHLEDEFFDDVHEAIWNYNNFQIYPIIDMDAHEIISILCDHPDASLNKVKVMRMSAPELTKHLKKCGAKTIEADEECIECPGYGLNVMLDGERIDLLDIEMAG